jgi:hypothetical protein
MFPVLVENEIHFPLGLSTTVLHFGVQTKHQKTLLLASFLSAFHFSFWWSVVRSPFDEL